MSLHAPQSTLQARPRMVHWLEDDMLVPGWYASVYPVSSILKHRLHGGLGQESGVHTRFLMGMNGAPSGKLLGCVHPRMIRICIHCPKHRYTGLVAGGYTHLRTICTRISAISTLPWARIPRLLTTQYWTKNAGNKDMLYSWGFKGNNLQSTKQGGWVLNGSKFCCSVWAIGGIRAILGSHTLPHACHQWLDASVPPLFAPMGMATNSHKQGHHVQVGKVREGISRR